MSKNYYRWLQTPEYTGWVEYFTGDRYVLPLVSYVQIGIVDPGVELGWSTRCIAVIDDPNKPPLLFDPVTLKQHDWNNHHADSIHHRHSPPVPYKWLRCIDRTDRNSTETIVGNAGIHIGMIQAIAGYWYDGPVRSGAVVKAAEDLIEKISETRKKVIASDTIKHGPVLQEVVSGTH